MLLLASTSDIVRVYTDATADVRAHASWVDNASGTITPGRTNTASITSSSPTTIVGSPSGSTQRNVKHLSLYNYHATQAVTCRVEHYDGTTAEPLANVVLAAGESLVMDAAGVWVHYDANKGPYVGLGPMAVQSDMEAATSLTRVVNPGVQQYHPSACKCWGFTTGGGTPSLISSYNTTSITDTNTGRLTVTIGVDFSSANYAVVFGATTTNSTTAVKLIAVNTKAAGTFEIDSYSAVTPTLSDVVVGFDWACFGDQ